jgi:hypothetical protein
MLRLAAFAVSAVVALLPLKRGAFAPRNSSGTQVQGQTDERVPYPDGYRQWAHVKSEILNPANPGFASRGAIHHIYANRLALDGYATGSFPDGAVIVADFLNPVDSGGVIREGSRNRIDVMIKNAGWYGATGGWGFERFRGNSRTDRMATPELVRSCFGCHASRKDRDHVFSTVRP